MKLLDGPDMEMLEEEYEAIHQSALDDYACLEKAAPEERISKLEQNVAGVLPDDVPVYESFFTEISSLEYPVGRVLEIFSSHGQRSERFEKKRERLSGIKKRLQCSLEQAIDVLTMRGSQALHNMVQAEDLEQYSTAARACHDFQSDIQRLYNLATSQKYSIPEPASLSPLRSTTTAIEGLENEVQTLVTGVQKFSWWQTAGKNHNKDAKAFIRSIKGNWFTAIFGQPLLKRCQSAGFHYGKTQLYALLNDLRHLRLDWRSEKPQYDLLARTLQKIDDGITPLLEAVPDYDSVKIQKLEKNIQEWKETTNGIGDAGVRSSLYLRPTLQSYLKHMDELQQAMQSRRATLHEMEMKRLEARGFSVNRESNGGHLPPVIVDHLVVNLPTPGNGADHFALGSYLDGVGCPVHRGLNELHNTLTESRLGPNSTVTEKVDRAFRVAQRLDPHQDGIHDDHDYFYLRHLERALAEATTKGEFHVSRIDPSLHPKVKALIRAVKDYTTETEKLLHFAPEQIARFQALYGANPLDFPMARFY